MGFVADIRSWDSVDAFDAHLRAHNPAVGAWASGGLVYHHTAIPAASWAPELKRRIDREWDRHEVGLSRDSVRAKRQRQLEGILAYYRDTLEWDRGPHLFVDDLFIWQMTPLSERGIHAGAANKDRIGIEVVGDYTRVPWPTPVARLALGAAAAWLRWQAIPVNDVTVRGHNSYGKPECPGKAINLGDVRLRLARINSPAVPLVAPVPTADTRQPVTPDALLLHPARVEIAQLERVVLRGPTGGYHPNEVRGILRHYDALCRSVGLDPLLVVAQLLHETEFLNSYWSQRPRRNPAGIGVNGMPGVGISFPTWHDDAIPAHVGRVLLYALPAGTGTPAQQALMSTALRWRGLPQRYLGCAPTLRGFVRTWAADGNEPHDPLTYADKLARVANLLLQGAA
jgi:hypothetical protein